MDRRSILKSLIALPALLFAPKSRSRPNSESYEGWVSCHVGESEFWIHPTTQNCVMDFARYGFRQHPESTGVMVTAAGATVRWIKQGGEWFLVGPELVPVKGTVSDFATEF